MPPAAPAPGPIAAGVGGSALSEQAASFGVGVVYSGAELAEMGGAWDPPAFQLVTAPSSGRRASAGSGPHGSVECADDYDDGAAAPSASDSESCLSDGPGGSFPHPEAVTAFFGPGHGGAAVGYQDGKADHPGPVRVRHPLSSGLPPEDVWAAILAGRPPRCVLPSARGPPAHDRAAGPTQSRQEQDRARAAAAAAARRPAAPLTGAAAMRARMMAAVRSAYEEDDSPISARKPRAGGPAASGVSCANAASRDLHSLPAHHRTFRGAHPTGRDEDRAWAQGRSSTTWDPRGGFR